MRKFLISFILANTALSGLATAEEINLGDILVTSSRVPIERIRSGRANMVITGDQLEDLQIEKVSDALRLVPGLSVKQTGGAGGLTTVTIRGSRSKDIMVMVDGIEYARNGVFNFASLTTDNVDRIEILRGPQSALWGASASAGVINIITKSGSRDKPELSGFIEGGSNKSFAGGLALSAGGKNFGLAIGANYRNEKGWNTASRGDEKDGYRLGGFNFKGDFDVSDIVTIRLGAAVNNYATDFDDGKRCGSPECYVVDAKNVAEGENIATGASADIKLFDGALVLTPSFSYAHLTSDSIYPKPGSDYYSRQTKLKAGQQISYAFGSERQHEIIGAFEFIREGYKSKSEAYASSNKDGSRGQLGYVIEYRGNLTKDLFMQLGARYDDNDKFKDAFTWSTSASYDFTPANSRIHASFGKGVTNPTFSQMYYSSDRFVGNPDLRPEENLSWDFGVEQSLLNDRVIFDVTYFDAKLKRAIVSFGKSAKNSDDDVKKRGVELSLTVKPIDNLSVIASYTYVKISSENENATIMIPQNNASLAMIYSFFDNKATIGSEIIYSGSNYQMDYSAGFSNVSRIKVDGSTVVNFSTSFKITDNLSIYARVKNAFDRDYYDVLGYKARPRTAYFGLKYSF